MAALGTSGISICASRLMPEAPSSMRKVSIVVPVYWNAPSLPVLFEHLQEVERQLRGMDFQLELIFVNDGSPDDSQAELLRIKDARPETKVIKLTRISANIWHQVRISIRDRPLFCGACR
jgi:glycosyltransferase involved in cell wall biosynthesis